MKTFLILVLALALASLSAQGGGGVDVGNGFRIEDYMEIGSYNKESQLVEDTEVNLGDLVSVDNSEIAKKIKLGQCAEDSVDFVRLEPEKIYLLDSNKKFTRSSYRGRVFYELKGCKKAVIPKK